MPSKVEGRGTMRSPDISGSSKYGESLSTKGRGPPSLPSLPPVNRRTSRTSYGTVLSRSTSRRTGGQFQANIKSRGGRRSGTGSEKTGSSLSKCSMSSATSTEEKQKEVDSPVLQLFDLKKRLGKGAYGIVWEAVEKRSGNQVALKKIFDAFRNSTDSQRTYREIMFLREFGHHPHIISLTSVHKASNQQDIYLVFPYMDHDLHKLVKMRPEALTDSVVRSIIYQVLVALKYLHSAEVIHRDLKPANILMDVYLHVKLADFGLARSLSNNPEETLGAETMNPVMTDYVATRWYRPPEILLSCKKYTKGVDLWSIACILGEMLLKKPLFPGSSTIDQLQTILKTIQMPEDEDIKELCQGNGSSMMTPDVIKAALKEEGDQIEDIFQEFDLETVDFIERLLIFNPDKRITVDQALAHPYLTSVRDTEMEWSCEHLVRPPISDEVKLEIEDYRQTIYEMIDRDESARIKLLNKAHPAIQENSQSFDNIKFPENCCDEIQDLNSYSDDDHFDLCEEYEQEFKEYAAKTQIETLEGDYQELIVCHKPYEFNNLDDVLEEPPLTPTSNEPFISNPSSTDNYKNDNDNNDDNRNGSRGSDWLNYSTPAQIISKSASDQIVDRSMKNGRNVSILTLPSENPKPYTVPMTLPSTRSVNTSKSGTATDLHIDTDISPQYEDFDEEDGSDIIQKFQSLCQKYDRSEDFGLLSNYKNESRQSLNDFNKAKNAESCANYEFLAQGDCRALNLNIDKTDQNNRSALNLWIDKNPTLMKSSTSLSQYQSKLPSLMEGDGDSQKHLGVRGIQESLSLAKGPSASFINPYKVKGLKTSLNDPDSFHSIGQKLFNSSDYEIRNSRSLPSQLDGLDYLKTGSEFMPPPMNNTKNKNISASTYNNNGKILRNPVEASNSKSFQGRQDQRTQGSTRLQQLFPNKNAMEDRIEAMERRVKGKGPTSQESLNSVNGLILVNGKNNTTNKINRRQKQSGDIIGKGKKFSYGIKEDEEVGDERPFGGRQYDKKFHGPSFRRTVHSNFSLSDPESTTSYQFTKLAPTDLSRSSWKPTAATSSQSANLRSNGKWTDGQVARKPISHSAYFPNAGVTNPLRISVSNSNHYYSNSKESDKLSSKKTVKTNGFSAVHPVSSYNSSSGQGHNSSLRPLDNRYPQQTSFHPQYEYDSSNNPAPAGSTTVRASDLFELRNNVAREKRFVDKYKY